MTPAGRQARCPARPTASTAQRTGDTSALVAAVRLSSVSEVQPAAFAESWGHVSGQWWCAVRGPCPQVYDVLNFDMIVMLRLSYVPGCCEWIYKVRCVHPHSSHPTRPAS